jgi:hypothetical protein
MTAPEDRVQDPLAPDEDERRRVLVRSTADVDRLTRHLFTHWTLPRIEIRIESLPAVAVQLFQHRIARISDAPTGGLVVTLATIAVVAGIYLGWLDFKSMIWTTRQFWQHLALIAIAALYAGLIGKGIGMALVRVRLMGVLRRLRRQLVAGKTVDEPARYVGRDLPHVPVKAAVISGIDDATDEVLTRRTVLSRPRRPKVVLRTAADVKRLLVHLFTHLKLPSVQISVDGVATLDVQRAQHRIVHLSEACNCVLGACLAGATLLGGAFVVEWISSHHWDWMVPESWGPLGMVPVAALCAALTGVAIEMVWNRVRLVLVVRGVRHRLAT